jgi:hypothetical protein
MSRWWAKGVMVEEKASVEAVAGQAGGIFYQTSHLEWGHPSSCPCMGYAPKKNNASAMEMHTLKCKTIHLACRCTH